MSSYCKPLAFFLRWSIWLKKTFYHRFFTFFYVREENIGLMQIFDFRFSEDLHALGFPEHDLTNFGKCLCVCVCDKKFVASVARDLMNRIS